MTRDVSEIVQDIGANKISGVAGFTMPSHARTTTTKAEQAMPKTVFKTKLFTIYCDDDARLYASFINWIIEDKDNRIIVREESTWTKDGALIRIVDFIQQYEKEGPLEEKQSDSPIHPDKEETFTPNDYVEE